VGKWDRRHLFAEEPAQLLKTIPQFPADLEEILIPPGEIGPNRVVVPSVEFQVFPFVPLRKIVPIGELTAMPGGMSS